MKLERRVQEELERVQGAFPEQELEALLEQRLTREELLPSLLRLE